METVKEKVNGIDVWFVIEPLTWHNKQRNLIVPTDKFICFFNFEKPGAFIYGELLRGEDNVPIEFKNHKEAIQYGRNYVIQKFEL